jgi:hypothetical protein
MPAYLAGMGIVAWLNHLLGLPTHYQDVMLVIGFGAYALVGSLLVARRPANPVSWIMAAIGLIVGLSPAAETYAAYVMITRGTPDALAVLGAWINAWYWLPLLSLALVYLPLLFPDGRLPSRRWLPIAIIPGIATAGNVVLGALAETLAGQNIDYSIQNPIGIKGMPPIEEHPLFGLLVVCMMIGVLGAAVVVFVRFRRSRGVERQQIKWFLCAVALVPIYIVFQSLPLVADLLFGLVIIAPPIAIGVAVLRYRLYDIDIIIRRTLIYAVLTAILALVYLGSVVVLQDLYQALTGEQTRVAVVLSTLVIAAMFNPLRRRIQNAIDRRFYRQKYSSEQALASFTAIARDETDLEALSRRLIDVVTETVHPEQVSLWLRSGKRE